MIAKGLPNITIVPSNGCSCIILLGSPFGNFKFSIILNGIEIRKQTLQMKVILEKKRMNSSC